ncbi:hypothetical protein NP233_g1326 [Leucocoprinus birnbaumii]|uniref:Zn(2)-C6 fungal-type domain-containing protein n=1 Tax=Leucocoprinus birnbaumii TaxID=56174 RepID=A0AAD5W389_9AGAR|nr:hypothetical protein NP233_g1326 [Leucocoprinus birnbaumii]
MNLGFLDTILLFITLGLSLAIVVPLTGVLVRFRANYNPKGLQLDAEGGAAPHTGPVVTSYFSMMGRVYRIEGIQGLYKGLMPTAISTFVVTLGTLAYSVGMMIISLPTAILTYRSITTPHKLGYFDAAKALRTILTPTERKKPWILYLTPGLLAAEMLHVAIVILVLSPFHKLLLPAVIDPDLKIFDISWWKMSIYFLIVALATLVLAPLEVIATRLAIQRNHASVEYDSVAQEAEGEEQAEYSGAEEDVIGLRHEGDPYTGMIDCAKRIMDEEGIPALYRACNSVFLLALYPAICHLAETNILESNASLSTKSAKTFVTTYTLYSSYTQDAFVKRFRYFAMSSENTTVRRGKGDVKPAAEGDHRKRRRNRTTQSCLNCHTSKRMCDRKRPACARCTQLGLTGLCVYEVDDPNQCSDPQDESARLLKRVAELEGVIRELKNKPHPRWIQATKRTAAELKRLAPRAQMRTTSGGGRDSGSNAPSPPSSLSEISEASSPGGESSVGTSSMTAAISLSATERMLSHQPSSSPSPGLITPPNEVSSSHASAAYQPEASQEYDFTSLLLSYPGLLGSDPASLGVLEKNTVLTDSRSQSSPSQDDCGCLHEAASYNVLLELSLRLRKAADALSRSASHRLGQHCHLHQRISELDKMVTDTLGNTPTPPEDLSILALMNHRSSGSHSLSSHSLHAFTAPSFAHPCRLPTPAESLPTLPSWGLPPAALNSPVASGEDDFMSWEPPRRF